MMIYKAKYDSLTHWSLHLKDDETYQLDIWNSGSYNALDVRQEESLEQSTSWETCGYTPPPPPQGQPRCIHVSYEYY